MNIVRFGKQSLIAARDITFAIASGKVSRYTIFAGSSTADEVRLLQDMLQDGAIEDGTAVTDYEARFAATVGTQHAFSYAAGRHALYAILEALEIGPGDEVILQAFTCVVVPNCLLYRGIKPVYVDIDPVTLNLNADDLARKITGRTRAIIVQHTFGLVADVDTIHSITAGRDISIIEDCAHALGARIGSRAVGALGDAAFFSTDHTKIISTGMGGMVTTDNAQVADTLRMHQRQLPFLGQSRLRRLAKTFVYEYYCYNPRKAGVLRPLLVLSSHFRNLGFFEDELETSKPTAYPYPARLGNLQAAIGIKQLERLDDNLQWRRRVAETLDHELGCHVDELSATDARRHVYLRYAVQVQNREQWVEGFRDLIDMDIWFTSVCHGRDNDLRAVGYEPGSCPQAERAARHCVSFPTHPRIDRPELLANRIKRIKDELAYARQT